MILRTVSHIALLRKLTMQCNLNSFIVSKPPWRSSGPPRRRRRSSPSQPQAMILGSTQSYDDAARVDDSGITQSSCWWPLLSVPKYAKVHVTAVTVVERIYWKNSPSCTGKHQTKWVESISRPAHSPLSLPESLQDSVRRCT